MNPRHAFLPDLDECMLEDRVLLYTPGLYNSGFLPLASGTNLIAVAGLNAPGGTGGSSPIGPQFYYILIGGAGGGGISQGSGSAGISVYGLASNNGYVNVSLGLGGSGSTTGASGSGTPTNLGYGGNVSSGYNTSLNISNNYGTSANTVGSMPVHSFDSGTATAPAGTTNSGTAGNTTATPDANTELWNSLLKRNTRNITGSSGTGMGTTGLSGTP